MLIIPTHSLSWLFPVTFLAAILLVMISYVSQGVREKYPLTKVFLVLSSCIMFFIVGSKMGTYSADAWEYFLQNLRIQPTGQKSALTGYPIMFLAAIIAAHWLKFNPLRLDKSALFVPLALIIQQFGCLFAGCCAGSVSTLPWAISYDAGSVPYGFQVQQGLDLYGHSTSLPVHPAPIYMVMLLGLALFILFKFRKKLVIPGSIRFSAIFLYLCCRFIAEFSRDTSNHHFGGDFFGGLKVVQWYMLAGIIIFGTFIFFWEKVWKHSPWSIRSYMPDHLRTITFLGFLMLLYTYILPSLDLAEKLIIQLLLLSSLAAVVVSLFLAFRKSAQRSLSLTLAMAGFLCLGQTYRDADLKKGMYYDWSLSGSYGHYMHDVRKVVGSESNGCGSQAIYSPYFSSKRTYTEGSLGFSVIKVNSLERVHSYVFGIASGSEADRLADKGISSTFSTYRIRNAYRYEAKSVGFMAGFDLGNMYYPQIRTSSTQVGSVDNQLKKNEIMTFASMRIGQLRKFYIRGAAGAMPDFGNQLGLFSAGMGTQFGNAAYPSVEFGLSTKSLYLHSEYAFSDAWFVQTRLISSVDKGTKPFGFSLGLFYRVNGNKNQHH